MIRNFCSAVYDGMICNYFSFSYRAPLDEFRPFMIFVMLCAVPSAVLYALGSEWAIWVAAVTAAVLLCPTLGMMVRRMHDTAQSGLSLLAVFVTIAMSAVVIWFEHNERPTMSEYSGQVTADDLEFVVLLFGGIIVVMVVILLIMLLRPTVEAYTPWDYSAQYPYPPLKNRRDKVSF